MKPSFSLCTYTRRHAQGWNNWNNWKNAGYSSYSSFSSPSYTCMQAESTCSFSGVTDVNSITPPA